MCYGGDYTMEVGMSEKDEKDGGGWGWGCHGVDML